ncbi:MAG: metal ABC transporter substrate-binding protein [Elusimicrobia bacterium]|nr:metal ABC transporter substrate-binding protein [Elusimicrobiota bacterium]
MKKTLVLFLTLFVAGISSVYSAQVKIASALPDLGSIASYIGGDKVEVFSIAKSNSNPHFVEVLPSYMIKVSRADIYLKVGLSLDQWSDQIIDGSRNNHLETVDCSNGISVLQKPSKVDSSMGDVHPEGNPHYWLNPSNGIVIAKNILEALKKEDPENSAFYEKNYEKFKTDTEKKLTGWKKALAELISRGIITYHSSWVYFADAFNLKIVGNVEPLPGIPPTGKHLSELVDNIKNNHIALLLQEQYFPDEAPRFLARQTGIKVIKVAPSCDGVKAEDYFGHFDDIIGRILKQ